MRQAFALPTLAISAVFALSACGGDDLTGPTAQRGSALDAQPPASVSIEVAVRTTGADFDPDGYSLGIDGRFYEVGLQELRTIDGLVAGEHTVWLTGLADNCELTGPATLRLDIAAGHAGQAEFNIHCDE